MSRNEFMKQLEALLQNISPAEREEALQYYNDYFDDAGAENEQSVIEALGNPARVAENIKRDLYGNGYGDNGYQRVSPNDKAVIPYGYEPEKESSANGLTYTANNATYNGQGGNGQSSTGTDSGKQLSGGMIALIVILCIIGSPIILSVLSGLIGILVGVVITWFSFIITFGIVAVVLILVALLLAVIGIMCILSEPFVAMGLIGGGMLCGGLGILFLMLAVAMAGIATPAMCNGIVGLIRKGKSKK